MHFRHVPDRPALHQLHQQLLKENLLMLRQILMLRKFEKKVKEKLKS
jgi:hypothetical protein